MITFIKHSKGKTIVTEGRSAVIWGHKRGRTMPAKRHRELLGVMEMLCILIALVANNCIQFLKLRWAEKRVRKKGHIENNKEIIPKVQLRR